MPDQYRVTLNNELITATSNEAAAWETYRRLLRRGDLRAQRPLASISKGDEVLHSALCDGRADITEIGPYITPNEILKLVTSKKRTQDLVAAAHTQGYPVTESRVMCWMFSASNPRQQVMSVDELYIVLAGLKELDKE
ncbi:hypothetical protein [Pseudomonas sp. PDM22]|uniref:hypothetical protein n=1 Tax=Pseudomonas sp. PDM22 TaxID=2769287 RepID=UPI0009DB17D3|nr:hypothetical protein [Pseudomonas sp. PDM22]MBD9517086.1 hypothetical protein [Pseudomonas sp. PDM22]OQR28455.1 hypothetical protein BWR15_27865 [Pseudomonas sp. T]